MSELKACMRCASENVEMDFGSVTVIAGDEHQQGEVICNDCGLWFPMEFVNEDKAHGILVEAWNNRPAENKIKAEGVREAIEAAYSDNVAETKGEYYVISYFEGYANKLEKGE